MKRALLAIAAALIAVPALADDMVYRFDADTWMRLTSAPCTVPAAQAVVKPQFKDRHRQGVASIDGREVALCWLLIESVISFVDADGEVGWLPVQLFNREPGI